MIESKDPVTRRGFFQAAGRTVALGALAAVALALGARGALRRDRRSCASVDPCEDCPALSGCAEPRADAAKAASWRQSRHARPG